MSIRTQYDSDLEALKAALAEMGRSSADAVEDALEALCTADADAAAGIVKGDGRINNMERDIEHRCMTLLLRQQPVAGDLRKVSTALKMVTDIERIADQAKVVGDSVHSFLRDLFVAMAIIIVVMMLLFPLRSAIVAALTIPMSTFISVGMMYLCGIPLNTVTLAALVVVLGMIVDNSIVVIDGYLDYLGRGHSRWFAAVESAREFFPSLLLATVCICMIFYPILFTMTGMMGDFLTWFPWTITINLMVSLLLAVLALYNAPYRD